MAPGAGWRRALADPLNGRDKPRVHQLEGLDILAFFDRVHLDLRNGMFDLVGRISRHFGIDAGDGAEQDMSRIVLCFARAIYFDCVSEDGGEEKRSGEGKMVAGFCRMRCGLVIWELTSGVGEGRFVKGGAVAGDAGVFGVGEGLDQLGGEFLLGSGIVGIEGYILCLVGVFVDIVELFGGAFGEGLVIVGLPFRSVAVGDEPGFGGAGVHVGECDARVVGELLFAGCVGVGDSIRSTHGPAVGCEVADVEKLRSAEGAVGVGKVSFAGGIDVAFAAGDDPGASWIDLAGGFGVLDFSPQETWIISTEMAFPKERAEESNRVLLAKIIWNQPNKLVSATPK